MTGTIGVAISTTGDEHRMGFLETCVKMWLQCLPKHSHLFVTVDGDMNAAHRVAGAVGLWAPGIYRVGRPAYPGDMDNQHRLGVAVNKNTGIELLMAAGVEHLFLSDDDCWPLMPQALDKHIELAQERLIPHSMVCWGKSRLLLDDPRPYAVWSWPRGVMLYAQRWVVEGIGGMDERFGPGGHEHVEWSQRIHNAGLTPAPFISPVSYALKGVSGNPATRADVLWECVDMRKPGEMPHEWDARKKRNTSIRRTSRDWKQIDRVMAERQGSADFVSFKAHENGRASATLCSSSSCNCAQVPEPETPRSAQ